MAQTDDEKENVLHKSYFHVLRVIQIYQNEEVLTNTPTRSLNFAFIFHFLTFSKRARFLPPPPSADKMQNIKKKLIIVELLNGVFLNIVLLKSRSESTYSVGVFLLIEFFYFLYIPGN